MAETTYVKLSKPAYQTLRYDLELNNNMDLLDGALRHFPGTYPPGDVSSDYPDVVLTDGITWLDTGNDLLKVYYNSAWVTIHTF